jgi:uncharacterized protein YbjT (DUF2867 family)
LLLLTDFGTGRKVQERLGAKTSCFRVAYISGPSPIGIWVLDLQTISIQYFKMKTTVIGASGFIGRKIVKFLESQGHEVTAAARPGVDVLTGAGLTDAVKDADTVIDVTNSPTFDADAYNFFKTSPPNIIKAIRESAPKLRHFTILSVVGLELVNSDYFKAKLIQEDLVRKSGIPFTIVRATQFYEFVDAIAQSFPVEKDAETGIEYVRATPRLFQPISGDDVAEQVARISLGQPHNDIVEIAGPQPIAISEACKLCLPKGKEIKLDENATYFGSPITDASLRPSRPSPILSRLTLQDWIAAKSG